MNPSIVVPNANPLIDPNTIARYIMKYEHPLPKEPIITNFFLEYLSAKNPTKDEENKYPKVLREKSIPITVPEVSSWIATRGIKKSKKKKPKLLKVMVLTISLKSIVKRLFELDHNLFPIW
jgi:hypothetical protein